MVQSTRRQRPDKPRGCPLFPHANGQWAKKIRQRTVYFGPWDDLKTALDRFKNYREDLMDGTIDMIPTDQTVRDVLTSYTSKRWHDYEAGELSASALDDYIRTANFIIRSLPSMKRIADLSPLDFEDLRNKARQRYGPTRLGNFITYTKSMFTWAKDVQLIDDNVNFGRSFRKPTRRIVRKRKREVGELLFTSCEIDRMIDRATPAMKAMIHLGLNGGFGNTDCASLPLRAVNLDAGVIRWPRPKTEVDRIVPLWSETVDALRDALKHRPTPRTDDAEDLFFITKYGRRWVRDTAMLINRNGKTRVKRHKVDSVALMFGRLLVDAACKRPRHGFYTLRRVFRTFADGTGDFPAIDVIMGHVTEGVGPNYVQRIDSCRIHAVVERVRQGVFPPP